MILFKINMIQVARLYIIKDKDWSYGTKFMMFSNKDQKYRLNGDIY